MTILRPITIWTQGVEPAVGGVVTKNVACLAVFAATALMLYHVLHVSSSPTHTILSAEVASCACPGKPSAPASTRCSETQYQEAASQDSRQAPVDHARPNLERLAKTIVSLQARNRHPLAQEWIPAVLEMEEQGEMAGKKDRSQECP
jgi:hypothetical protein